MLKEMGSILLSLMVLIFIILLITNDESMQMVGLKKSGRKIITKKESIVFRFLSLRGSRRTLVQN
jgi:hypothetical protein